MHGCNGPLARRDLVHPSPVPSFPLCCCKELSQQLLHLEPPEQDLIHGGEGKRMLYGILKENQHDCNVCAVPWHAQCLRLDLLETRTHSLISTGTSHCLLLWELILEKLLVGVPLVLMITTGAHRVPVSDTVHMSQCHRADRSVAKFVLLTAPDPQSTFHVRHMIRVGS